MGNLSTQKSIKLQCEWTTHLIEIKYIKQETKYEGGSDLIA